MRTFESEKAIEEIEAKRNGLDEYGYVDCNEKC